MEVTTEHSQQVKIVSIDDSVDEDSVLTIKLSFWLLTTLHKRFLRMPNTSIRYQRTEKFPSQET